MTSTLGRGRARPAAVAVMAACIALSACNRSNDPIAGGPAVNPPAPATAPATAAAGTTTGPMAASAPPSAGSGPASAGGPAGPAATPGPALAAADRQFIDAAASGGMLEVEASRLALSQGQSKAVKTFAQHMVDDHSAAGDELKALASGKAYPLPPALNARHAAQLDALRGLKGVAFDREYAASIGVGAHHEAIATFERGARDAGDGDVRAFAEKTLPKLRDHLKEAEAMARAVGVPATRLKDAEKAARAEGMQVAGAPAPSEPTTRDGAVPTTGGPANRPAPNDTPNNMPSTGNANDRAVGNAYQDGRSSTATTKQKLGPEGHSSVQQTPDGKGTAGAVR